MNRPALKRLSHIARILFREGMGFVVDRLHLRAHLPWPHRFRQPTWKGTDPERVRHILEELGASYIKLGQLLSLRPDLVPRTYSDEFRKLQDELPPCSFRVIKRVLRQELQQPLRKVFRFIESKPIGSASIAQVHRAILQDGTKVVLKVQRPRIAERFAADIDVMYFLAHRLKKYVDPARFSPVEIVREFERYTQEELDFLIEADHVTKFEEQFEGNTKVKIPHCYQKHSTHKVLVLEELRGKKLSSLVDDVHAPQAIIQNILELGLKQIFRMSIFHADLHPGNIIVLRDGRIGLLDFGITGSLLPHVREQGVQMYLALIDKDVDAAVDALLAAGDLPEKLDRRKFRKEIRSIITIWHSGSTRGKRVTHELHNMLDVCVAHDVRLPPDMILLAKALVTMEATCLRIDPDFDFVEASKPYLVDVLESEFRSEFHLRELLKRSLSVKEFLERFPRQVLDTMGALEKGRIHLEFEDEEIRHLGRRLTLSSDRLSLAAIAGSFVVAGGLILQTNIPPLVAGYSLLAVVAFSLAFIVAFVLFVDVMQSWRS